MLNPIPDIQLNFQEQQVKTQNTDKQSIIYLTGVPNIEGNQVHRIVHRKNALICLFLPCTKNKKIPVKY